MRPKNSQTDQKEEKSGSISIKLFNSDKKSNAAIKKTIEDIFSLYKRRDLTDIVYFCIKELISNAIMTNVKSLFFTKNNLNINSISDYVAGITQFNEMIDKNGARKYYSELEERDLWVRFNIKHNKNGLKFEITNNSPIIGIEEKQIRMKLQKSMIFIDLFDIINPEEYDGYDEKMGLALVLILLKKAKLDASLFRIGTINGITLSRIEVPFSSTFSSSRKSTLKK